MTNRFLISLSLLALGACQSAKSTVTLDLSGLSRAMAGTAAEDEAAQGVAAEGDPAVVSLTFTSLAGEEIDRDVPLDEPLLEIELSPGSWKIEGWAWAPDLPRVPVFWGFVDVELVPGPNQVVLDVYPAGLLVVEASAADGTDVRDVSIILKGVATPPEFPREFELVLDDSQGEIRLPAGAFDLESFFVGSSTNGDVTYRIPENASAEILKGAETVLNLVYSPDAIVVGECEADNPSDFDQDGEDCLSDCDDEDALLNNLDLDSDGNTTCDLVPDCDDEDADLNSLDADEDGVSTCPVDAGGIADCDDTDPNRTPGAVEIPANGIDEDCDGLEACFVDADNDGWGTPATTASTDLSCTAAGLSTVGLDCDDGDAAKNFDDADGDGEFSCSGDCNDSGPNAAQMSGHKDENCQDGIDNNCNGLTDGADPDCFQCADSDGDGYACSDCDDQDPTRNPQDADNDGHSLCDYDCDDTDPERALYRIEKCNDGKDNDCDGLTDLSDSDCSGVDDDGDGYTTATDCDDSDPNLNHLDQDNNGLTSCAGDCLDTNFFGGLPLEFCYDGIDNDCNGFVDAEDTGCSCADNDGDGFKCGDCDDSAETGYLCMWECNNLYVDGDGDGAGDIATTRFTCERPGWAYEANDCNDADPNQSPFLLEICDDGIDNDCSGGSDDLDFDYDGFSACGPAGIADCNDTDPGIIPVDIDGDGVGMCSATPDCDEFDPYNFPGNAEICDGKDNDCDAVPDNGFDLDSDGVPSCIDNCPNDPNAPNISEPTLITFYVQGYDPSQTDSFEFFLNDVSLGTGALTGTTCGTNFTEDPFGFSGPFAMWNANGDNHLRVVWSGTNAITVSFRAELDPSTGIETVCLWDRFGGCGDAPTCGVTADCLDCPNDVQQGVYMSPPQPDVNFNGIGDACDACDSGTQGFEICFNAVDDDCNVGTTDTDTASCCDPAVHDLDGDGAFVQDVGICDPPDWLRDCDDNAGNGQFANPGRQQEFGFECSDGLDNDCDGLIDSVDPDCPEIACDTPNSLGQLVAGTGYERRNFRWDSCSFAQEILTPDGVCSTSSGETAWVEMDLQDPMGVAIGLELCNRGNSATLEILQADFAAGGCEVGTCGNCVSGCMLTLAPGECQVSEGWPAGLTGLAVRPTGGCSGELDLEVAYTGGQGPMFVDFDSDGTDDNVDDCVDGDLDGYGLAGFPNPSCANGGNDCDDTNNQIPGVEVCDYVDNNCDGQVDEGETTFQLDFFDVGSNAAGWNTGTFMGANDWMSHSTSANGPAGSPIAFPENFFGTHGNGPAPGIHRDVWANSPGLTGLSGPPTIGVRFDSYTHNEGGCWGSSTADGPDAEVVMWSDDGGSTFNPLHPCLPGGLNQQFDGGVRQVGFPLPGGSDTGMLRFRYDSYDAYTTQDPEGGWYFDNVEIYTCDPP